MSELHVGNNSNHHVESKSIWQYNDLDTNLVSIYCIPRSAIKNTLLFKSFVQETEKQTGCVVNLYGLESSSEVIWMKIKNSSREARENALQLINALTQNSCKEIILPKPSDIPTPLKTSSNKTNNPNASSTKVKSASGDHDEFNEPDRKKDKPREVSKKPLVRSLTENSILSLSNSNSNEKCLEKIIENDGDFSLNDRLNLNGEEATTRTKTKEDPINQTRSDNTKPKKRYTLEFLLSRSDKPQSQQMPENWSELSEKYPTVCFNGKIISHFNPNKYFIHWNKVKLQNSELHSSNFIHPTKSFNPKSSLLSPVNLNFNNTQNYNKLVALSSACSSSSSMSSTSNQDDYLHVKSGEHQWNGPREIWEKRITFNNLNLNNRFDFNNNDLKYTQSKLTNGKAKPTYLSGTNQNSSAFASRQVSSLKSTTSFNKFDRKNYKITSNFTNNNSYMQLNS